MASIFRVLLMGLCVALAGCTATSPARDDRAAALGAVEMIRGDFVVTDEIVARAERSPLGSQKNPIRALMPDGSRAYLDDLRCPGGVRLSYRRVGSFGASPFGGILDRYDYVCPGGRTGEVFVDMYHPEHRERRAPPGLSSVR